MPNAVYIHIPFCKTICSYCDFCKIYYENKYIDTYLEKLEQEIKERYKNELIDTIYIGGGTPTCLNEQQLEHLLKITKLFKINKTIEFSIESNIESLTEEKIKLLKKYGVNRVSLGVQSFNKEILTELNRHHTKEMVYEVIKNLKKHNIHNLNIDLIYGVNENLDILKQDIDEFLNLNIPHLSCYSLIIEDNTIFKNKNREYIDANIEYEMYKYINKTLKAKGYLQYEISNYCKKDYESHHNMTYWQNNPYYGFGLGAVSYLNNFRINNTKNLTKYLNGFYIQDKNYEDEKIRMENEIILGLRLTKGVNLNKFKEKYNKNLEEIFNIEKLLEDKKLIIENDYLYINKDYLYLSNDILINFID